MIHEHSLIYELMNRGESSVRGENTNEPFYQAAAPAAHYGGHDKKVSHHEGQTNSQGCFYQSKHPWAMMFADNVVIRSEP